jgi:hypothetical protein
LQQLVVLLSTTEYRWERRGEWRGDKKLPRRLHSHIGKAKGRTSPALHWNREWVIVLFGWDPSIKVFSWKEAKSKHRSKSEIFLL